MVADFGFRRERTVERNPAWVTDPWLQEPFGFREPQIDADSVKGLPDFLKISVNLCQPAVSSPLFSPIQVVSGSNNRP